MRRLSCVLVLLVVGCRGSDRAAQPAIPLGEARLAVPGGNIWYKVSGTNAGTPLVLLHGGPGFNSFYLKPFEDLGDDRIVVRYDQLGGGKSDTTSDTTLFTIAHFVQELDSSPAATSKSPTRGRVKLPHLRRAGRGCGDVTRSMPASPPAPPLPSGASSCHQTSAGVRDAGGGRVTG